MPKAKTHKGAAKRVRVTKTGKVKFRHVNTGHLLSSRSSKRRRKNGRRGVAAASDTRVVLQLLGGARP